MMPNLVAILAQTEIIHGKDEFTYIIETNTIGTGHRIDKFEITEIDTWFAKFIKEYDYSQGPEIKETPATGSRPNEEGTYENQGTETITDQERINQIPGITEFKTEKENDYKRSHPTADVVTCTINSVEETTWLKEDKEVTVSGGAKTYKFIVDETASNEISYKNVLVIDNELQYTDKDEEGNEEHGFLYLYDKYVQKEDIFLEQDAERELFNMLEKDVTTSLYSRVIKYLLYVYDGIDRGLDELDLEIFRVREIILRQKSLSMLLSIQISREDFIEKVQNFSHAVNNPNTKKFRENAGVVYDVCVENYINPVWCAAQGWKEQHWVDGPSIKNNYWGIAVYNGQNYGNCYDTVQDGVQGYCDLVNSILYGSMRSLYQSKAQLYATVNSKFKGDMSVIYDIFSTWAVTDDPDLIARANGAANYVDNIIDIGKMIFGDDIFRYRGTLNWDGEVYESRDYTFPVYNQYDHRWTGHLYGGPKSAGIKTIGSSGCGCVALSVILSGYLGEAITPDVLTDELDDIFPDGRYYTFDAGSNSHLYDDVVLNRFDCTILRGISSQQAMDAFNEGYAVLGGETGHYLAFVPTSEEDLAQGYIFRIIDGALGHNALCYDFSDASRYVNGSAFPVAIIYPPNY